MRSFTRLGLAALTLVFALPAAAQQSGLTYPVPPPNMEPSTLAPPTPNPPAPTSASQVPAAQSGTRALSPGQNPDGTPSTQSSGKVPQLPGVRGQGK